MTIREEIKRYNFYLAKIERLNLEIHEIEDQIVSLKSPTIDGLPRASGYSGSSIEEKIINNDERIQRKKSEIQKLKDIINLLDKLINTLKESNRKIIKDRFIDNLDIQTIADKGGKEYRTIQATIDNSLNEMQENYDKMY